MPHRHAFLVEDNPTIRDNLIASLAEMSDVDVVGTAEGENEAVAWLMLHPTDADFVILDLFLAQGSGIGVLKQLLALDFGLPVVVLTNYATDDVRQRCAALGARALFDKSEQIEEFFAFCENGLPRPGTLH